MKVQLTIQESSAVQDQFSKPVLYELEQELITIGSNTCDCPLAGITEKVLQIIKKPSGFYLQILSSNHQIKFRNKKLNSVEDIEIFSGDSFQLDDWQISFYLRFSKRKLSWQSNFPSLIAKTGVTVLLILQLLCLFILPILVKQKKLWQGQQMRLGIVAKVDYLRKLASSIDNPDIVVQLLCKSYQDELKNRTAYLRENSEKLSRAQRKKMIAALAKIEQQLLSLQDSKLLKDYPELQLEKPVQKIINTGTNE